MGSTWRLPPKATEPGASLPSPVGEHMLGWRCGALETTTPGTPWGPLFLAGGFPGPDCRDERAEGKPAQILGGDKKEK